MITKTTMAGLLSVALLGGGSAYLYMQPKVVATSSGIAGSMLLFDSKCTLTTIGAHLELHDRQGKKVDDGCWIKEGDTIYIITKTLGPGELSADAFKWR